MLSYFILSGFPTPGFQKRQTIGKYILRLKCVDEVTFKPATSGRYLINNLTKASLMLLIDVIIELIANSGETKKRNSDLLKTFHEQS